MRLVSQQYVLGSHHSSVLRQMIFTVNNGSSLPKGSDAGAHQAQVWDEQEVTESNAHPHKLVASVNQRLIGADV